MSLECAHCGARAPSGSTRCPQCLRSTGLVQFDEAAPVSSRSRTGAVAALLALLAFSGLGLTWWARRTGGHRHVSQHAAPPIGNESIPPPFETGAQLQAWVAAIGDSRDPLGRARAALDRIGAALQNSGARVVTEPEQVPRSRTLAAIAVAISRSDGRVTSLDLARFETGLLRASGVDAALVEQTRSLRPDEPADPSGVLGRYAVSVRDHGVDPVAGAIVAAREIGARSLDEHAVAGAMLAQSALADALSGQGRGDALDLADRAVQQWPDGALPLAVRARVNQLLGGPGAAEIARQNLDAALAIRDDAPIHLLRARDALVSGALTSTLSEVRNALRLAPHWGDAAVAFAIVGSRAPDAGDRCEPLAGSHEPWAPDALRLCREGASPDPSLTAAAQRLSDTSRDPIRLALAASGGATGTLARVLAADRAELAAWLLLVGRPDLAEQALGTPDAGR